MDCYAVLEIEEGANEEAISKAYRRLALKYHPDKDKGSASKFRDINAAYETLKNRPRTPVTKAAARVRRGTDIQTVLRVTQDEFLAEISKTIVTTRNKLCPACSGSGSQSGVLDKCDKCNGTGIDLVSAIVGPKRFCQDCKGYGTLSTRNCKECSGMGVVLERITRTIKLSRENQSQAVLQGSGNYPGGGGIPGDLIIKFKTDRKSLFEISGKDIKGTIMISPAQAVLGDTDFIDVFGDPVKVMIPAGTCHGAVLKLKDRGVGKGSKKGDLILKVNLIIPENVSCPEEKKLYQQLLNLQKGIPS